MDKAKKWGKTVAIAAGIVAGTNLILAQVGRSARQAVFYLDLPNRLERIEKTQDSILEKLDSWEKRWPRP